MIEFLIVKFPRTLEIAPVLRADAFPVIVQFVIVQLVIAAPKLLE